MFCEVYDTAKFMIPIALFKKLSDNSLKIAYGVKCKQEIQCCTNQTKKYLCVRINMVQFNLNSNEVRISDVVHAKNI